MNNKSSLSIGARRFLLILPLIVAVLAVMARKATGPYWLAPNLDPSYIYLINSLYLLENITPIFVDHPGTTLQMLGALIIRLCAWNTPVPEIPPLVFENPEYFLSVINGVLVILYCISLIAVGFYAFKVTQHAGKAMLIQTPSLLFLTLRSYNSEGFILPIIANVGAEAFLITIINLYILCVLRHYAKKEDESATAVALFYGVVCALGIVTKVSFAPLVFLPLLVLPGLRTKLLFCIGLVVTWLVVTSPVAVRYEKMFLWLKSVLIHTGGHGSGEIGLIDVSAIGSILRWIVSKHLYIVGIFVMVAAYLIYGTYRGRAKADNKERVPFLFLRAFFVVIVLQILMVIKQPSPHYLTPTIGLSGLFLFFFFSSFEKRIAFAQRGLAVFLVIFVVIHTLAAVYYLGKLQKRNTAILSFAEKMYSQHSQCAILPFYRSSSKLGALDFGDDCFGYKAFGEAMKRQYPSAYFFNRWNRVIHDFSYDASLKKIMQAHPCVLFHGDGPAPFPEYIKVEKIESGPGESFYRLIAFTGEQAVAHYLAAKQWEERGDYQKAYWFATRAKVFGFPKIDEYLQELKLRVNDK